MSKYLVNLFLVLGLVVSAASGVLAFMKPSMGTALAFAICLSCTVAAAAAIHFTKSVLNQDN